MVEEGKTTTAPSRQRRSREARAESRQRIVGAATELVRQRSYAELSVGEIMERAGFGRTIFYRHFDDLGDLLISASREAIEQLYEAEAGLAPAAVRNEDEAIHGVIEAAVAVYERHGPLLRAVTEAAAYDERVAAGRAALLERFDELVARSLSDLGPLAANPPADVYETARALNLLNESYLLDAFGREPRVAPLTATQTLTEIWDAVIHR
jgi:TetR/AcrR family transcriptional regulator, ethionamide resistance regulator